MPLWSKSKWLSVSFGRGVAVTPQEGSASYINRSHVSLTTASAELENNRSCWNTCRGDQKTSSGQRNEMIKILTIILIPVCILIGLTGNTLGQTLNDYFHSTSIRSTLLFSLDLAYLIRYLQRERDGSALYLTSIRPETKGFLLERYLDTDKAISTLPEWPTSLTNIQSEFQSSETFLKTLNKHRYELDSQRTTYHDELITYSNWIEVFITWFYKSITEARSQQVWKEFVAYQELLVASEYLGRERAMGVIFYTLGQFPTREEYLYFVESQDTSNSAFAAARQYSIVAKTIYDAKIKENPELMETIKNKRAEIRSRISGAVINTEGSLEEAKFWFENMTYFQDMIREAQVQLAQIIDGLLEARQNKDITNMTFSCTIFTVVIFLCPIIVYAVYNMTAEIKRCSILIEDRNVALVEERGQSDVLLLELLPGSVLEQLKHSVVIPKLYDQATVMFIDIFGFNQIYCRSSPAQVVEMLNTIHKSLDDVIKLYDVYKAETIGDAYMLVSGAPTSTGRSDVSEIATLSLDVLDRAQRIEISHIPEMNVNFRIGCHTGPVVTGVIGTNVPRYGVMGETVPIALKMEQLGQPNKIHMSENTANVLMDIGGFILEKRENFMEKTDPTLMAAFHGDVKTYWLIGREGFEYI